KTGTQGFPSVPCTTVPPLMKKLVLGAKSKAVNLITFEKCNARRVSRKVRALKIGPTKYLSLRPPPLFQGAVADHKTVDETLISDDTRRVPYICTPTQAVRECPGSCSSR